MSTLKNARMTAATASSGGLRCPYAVGSPAPEINSSSIFPADEVINDVPDGVFRLFQQRVHGHLDLVIHDRHF